MNKEEAKELIKKYDSGLADADEKALLDNWYLQESRKTTFTEEESQFLFLKSEIWDATLQQSGLKPKLKSGSTRLWSGIAAAVALVGISAALFFYNGSKPLQIAPEPYANDVAPGGDKATLTLADGRKISLTAAQNGNLAQQAGAIITKLADGQIIYSMVASDGSTEASEVTQNTITTPNGGKYQVILPDGTKVMLNAASSLTFPTAFRGDHRQVKLDGEAYFEVAENKKQPFSVSSGTHTVEVLGTHFNINAYSNEKTIKTTLLEGSVKVSVGQRSALIVPGQQTLVERDNPLEITKREADLSKEMAWKNGVFSFENDDLKSVMRQISRWYDVNVVYSGNFPDEEFFGEISRNSNLSEVAKILELNNIHLDIADKTIKVTYLSPIK